MFLFMYSLSPRVLCSPTMKWVPREQSRVETDLEGSLLAAADILLALAQGRQTQGGRGGVLVC